MMKWGFSETRFSDRYLTNLPGSISVFQVFSLSWSCSVWFEDVIWMGVAAGGIRGKLRNYSKIEWMNRFDFRANCDMQMRLIFTLCSALSILNWLVAFWRAKFDWRTNSYLNGGSAFCSNLDEPAVLTWKRLTVDMTSLMTDLDL